MDALEKPGSGSPPAALVLDESSRGDIGLVRGLGLAGIPVHLASSDARSPTRWSRFVTRVHEMPAPDASGTIQAERLAEIARAIGGRPPVLMAGDRTLALVFRHRERLEPFVRLDLAPTKVLEACFHKDRFAEEAARLGLPVPETNVVSSLEDVRAIAPELTYPVFVKPCTKKAWGDLPPGVVEAQKGQRVHDREALVRLFEGLAPHDATEAIVQTYVASSDSEHYSVLAYVLPDGTFAGAFTTRKLRVYPPHGGVGCLVLSERVPELVDTTRDVLSALGYHGFALVQYKRDATSGRYFLLEINCRHSTSGELAVRCGSNWPAVAHAALTGLDLPPVGQVEGRSWLDRERDRAAIRGYRELGEWAFGDGLRTLRTVRYGAFFAADDPGPALRFNLNRVRTRLQKSRHRRETAS